MHTFKNDLSLIGLIEDRKPNKDQQDEHIKTQNLVIFRQRYSIKSSVCGENDWTLTQDSNP